jgi:hypothetical protein
MDNKVDKLFKEKLESHSLQPSAQAWEKVEAHLGKKNRMVLWVRVAAAVALFGVLTIVGLNWNDDNKKTKEIAKDEVTKERNDEGTKKETIVEEKEQPAPAVRKDNNKQSVADAHEVVDSRQKTVDGRDEAAVDTGEVEQQVASITEPVVEPVVTESVAEQHTPGIENEAKSIQKGITLTYSLPPVKKEEPAVVAQVEEKKTGLERVLEIAREVKNGDPLGELREAKNDILALEFRKDKNKKH